MKMRFLVAAALSTVISGTTLAPMSFAATAPEKSAVVVLKKKKTAEVKKLPAVKKPAKVAQKPALCVNPRARKWRRWRVPACQVKCLAKQWNGRKRNIPSDP